MNSNVKLLAELPDNEISLDSRKSLNTELQSALKRIADQISETQAIFSNEAQSNVLEIDSNISNWLNRTVKLRKLREKHFLPGLFSDPAWDILLDLALAKIEGQKISVSSLCIAASVPTTTALRRIRAMMDAGLIRLEPDIADKRRTYVAIDERTYDSMVAYVSASFRLVSSDLRCQKNMNEPSPKRKMTE